MNLEKLFSHIERHSKQSGKPRRTGISFPYSRKEKWNYPELIVFAGWTLFDKGAEIGGDVAVV